MSHPFLKLLSLRAIPLSSFSCDFLSSYLCDLSLLPPPIRKCCCALGFCIWYSLITLKLSWVSIQFPRCNCHHSWLLNLCSCWECILVLQLHVVNAQFPGEGWTPETQCVLSPVLIYLFPQLESQTLLFQNDGFMQSFYFLFILIFKLLLLLLLLLFWPRWVACRILVPWPGIEPGVRQWEHWVLTTGPPGNSHMQSF